MPTYQTQHLGQKTLSGYSISGHNSHYGISIESKTPFPSRFDGYQFSNYEFLTNPPPWLGGNSPKEVCENLKHEGEEVFVQDMKHLCKKTKKKAKKLGKEFKKVKKKLGL